MVLIKQKTFPSAQGEGQKGTKMKLNRLIEETHVTADGFQALKDFAKMSQSSGEKRSVIVSSLSPAVNMEQGVHMYYAPVLPRGVVFNTAEDVKNADLDVNFVCVSLGLEADRYANKMIVSRHAGTVEILREMYPDAVVLSGNIKPEDIEGAFVVGTLPPHLIQFAGSYQAVTIRDFDYAKDGDLTGEELKSRIHISAPIQVVVS